MRIVFCLAVSMAASWLAVCPLVAQAQILREVGRTLGGSGSLVLQHDRAEEQAAIAPDGTTFLLAQGESEYVLRKINSQAQVLWSRALRTGDNRSARGVGVHILANGDPVVLAAGLQQTGDDPAGLVVLRLASSDGRLRWRSGFPGIGFSTKLDFALYEDLVFVQRDAVVRAVQVDTGAEVWRTDLGSLGFTSKMAVGSARVAVVDGASSQNGGCCTLRVRSLDSRSGALLWTSTFDQIGEISGISDPQVVVGASGEILVATPLWTTPMAPRLIAVSDNGTLLWQRSLSQELASMRELRLGLGLQGDPVVAAFNSESGNRDYRLVRIDRASGQTRWSHARQIANAQRILDLRLDATADIAVLAHTHTLGGQDQVITLHQAADGTPRWSRTWTTGPGHRLESWKLGLISGSRVFALSRATLSSIVGASFTRSAHSVLDAASGTILGASLADTFQDGLAEDVECVRNGSRDPRTISRLDSEGAVVTAGCQLAGTHRQLVVAKFTGEGLQWTRGLGITSTENQRPAAVVSTDSMVVLASATHFILFGLDPATGQTRWTWPSPPNAGPITGQPEFRDVIDLGDGTVLAVGSEMDTSDFQRRALLVRVDASTGALLYRSSIDDPGFNLEARKVLATVEGQAYVTLVRYNDATGVRHQIARIEPGTGALQWRWQLQEASQPWNAAIGHLLQTPLGVLTVEGSQNGFCRLSQLSPGGHQRWFLDWREGATNCTGLRIERGSAGSFLLTHTGPIDGGVNVFCKIERRSLADGSLIWTSRLLPQSSERSCSAADSGDGRYTLVGAKAEPMPAGSTSERARIVVLDSATGALIREIDAIPSTRGSGVPLPELLATREGAVAVLDVVGTEGERRIAALMFEADGLFNDGFE
ncbi:PQQ-binding-like beta-propeller repeat protein [Aquimonas voraii]|uniref:Outer membrane protein assembly factor BamB, contains PQQ-like beta-propeller repeat n=1 Tax=Aquimonas voraii TaxID=265719 RepID=A0A1G6ZKS1_9GAMM|nr:PQQ-binding-like beta-propeller repeat protein [Aquimonas voraii]SDE03364.1 Outer membrane protein assembly factor BamB, contains PQQ-like beta-propeller repeat [Aquimonas voraii]